MIGRAVIYLVSMSLLLLFRFVFNVKAEVLSRSFLSLLSFTLQTFESGPNLLKGVQEICHTLALSFFKF